MSIDSSSETAIFERIVLPADPSFSDQTAKLILALDFAPADRIHMQELAEKARRGILSPTEEREIESYERVGHYLAILQSKARLHLRHDGSASS